MVAFEQIPEGSKDLALMRLSEEECPLLSGRPLR